MVKFVLFWSALVLGTSNAFAPICNSQRNKHELAALPKEVQQLAGAFLISSTVLSNVVLIPAASATTMDEAMETTTQLLAARSGGRAGGRAAPRAAARPAPSTRVVERQTTIVQPSTVMMAPPPMYMAPQPSGLGLALGLNAVSGISEGFREARQENEIRSTREQLTEARIKEAEMEARLRALESAK